MESIDHRRTALNVDRITLFTEGAESGQYAKAHFDLYSGQLALVRLDNLRQVSSFADTFSGLMLPSHGRIRFFGRDWRDSPADTANAMRGKIGRVFSAGSWLDGLSLADNLLLPQMHHTRRPMDELRQEAAKMAEQFDLPGLPLGNPNHYSRADLRRAGCVRAFLGKPSLLLLEDPTFGVYPDIVSALVNAIRRVRNKGAAVFWMTLSDDVWLDESVPADRHFRISGRELMEVNRTT